MPVLLNKSPILNETETQINNNTIAVLLLRKWSHDTPWSLCCLDCILPIVPWEKRQDKNSILNIERLNQQPTRRESENHTHKLIMKNGNVLTDAGRIEYWRGWQCAQVPGRHFGTSSAHLHNVVNTVEPLFKAILKIMQKRGSPWLGEYFNNNNKSDLKRGVCAGARQTFRDFLHTPAQCGKYSRSSRWSYTWSLKRGSPWAREGLKNRKWS